MTSVFLTISLLCLWIYVLIKGYQDNKRYKEDIKQRTETLNVMKRMWDFEKELCEKLNESNHDNWVYNNRLRNIIDEHVNNKSIHAVHYEIKTFSTEENKDDKNN